MLLNNISVSNIVLVYETLQTEEVVYKYKCCNKTRSWKHLCLCYRKQFVSREPRSLATYRNTHLKHRPQKLTILYQHVLRAMIFQHNDIDDLHHVSTRYHEVLTSV